MNFASDNHYGASPEILAALGAIGQSPAPAYGDDAITRACGGACARSSSARSRPIRSSTARRPMRCRLATLVPPHGAILCHAEAHIAVDECGAPEFFTHGAKLVPIEGADAKLTPATIEQALGHFQKGFVHHAQPTAISLTQSTELGTVYTPAEIAAISAVAREHGMKLHMDGARFANALVGLGCTPAELTWKAASTCCRSAPPRTARWRRRR